MYSIKINSKEKVTDVSEALYGLFFEDINRAGDGGIYAELLRNRAFDDGILPEGCVYDPEKKFITSPTGWSSSFDCYEKEGIAAWEAMGGAKMELTDKNTLNENRKRALKVNFNGGYIRNDGFRGIFVEQDKSYRYYMFVKADTKVKISVMLSSKEGEVYAEETLEVYGEYQKYECKLKSSATDFDARLVIGSETSDTVIIGFTSLFPMDTYMGRENGLRKSLVERMLALNPSFLRFPGGCIVEGFTKETAFRFKDTIGPVWERKPHWLLWAYMTTNGLGFHEYLQFCEDAGIDGMYVFNCGMTCQGRNPDYFDDELIEQYYEDTVQAILYATAPDDTEWGAKRAANGHPEPFKVIKYLEIGNENWGPEYNKRYKLFYDKLKKEFPEFIYISTDHTEKAGLKTEMVDEHFYSDPVFFVTNEKMYDGLDRNGIDIYCGEYAATIGCKEGNLYGALGEAAFLTGIERNQDKVRMTSYAPMFQNVAYKAWEPDMIIFNNHEDYVIPSYYMLEMFGNNRGDYVCKYDVSTIYDKRREVGGFGVVVEDGIRFSDIKVNDKICYHVQMLEGTIEAEADSGIVAGNGIGIVGNVTENAQSFLAKVETAAGKFRIRFWDSGKRSDDQKHYDWICEEGKSKVLHYNGWSCEVICEDVICEILGSNEVKINVLNDSFEIFLNEKLLHSANLKEIPHITAVCTVDKQNAEVITKVVNFSENEILIQMCTDVEMKKEAEVITLTGDDYHAKNTFENKQAVCPYTTRVSASSDYMLQVKPRSINIIKHKMDTFI